MRITIWVSDYEYDNAKWLNFRFIVGQQMCSLFSVCKVRLKNSCMMQGWTLKWINCRRIFTPCVFCRPAFYFYGILKILSAVLMMTIDLEFKTPAKNVIKDVVRVLKKIEIIALFFTCFILGWYFISVLRWLLINLSDFFSQKRISRPH